MTWRLVIVTLLLCWLAPRAAVGAGLRIVAEP